MKHCENKKISKEHALNVCRLQKANIDENVDSDHLARQS